VRGTAALTTVVTLLLAVASPVLIRVVFGVEFVPAVGPTLMALTGTTGVVLAYVASSVLTALGRGWVMTTASALGCVVGVGLAFVLGPPFGAMGLAVASSIGFWVSAVLCVVGLPVQAKELTLRRSDLRASISDLAARPDRGAAQ
jgi:O-antigen/teichoic acid export membrane protein